MDIFNIPEALSVPIRLKIISCLVSGEKTFTEIKQIIKASDGNISVQLTKLENWGYVTSRKRICDKKGRTSYTITEFGLQQLEQYVNLLEDIIKSSQ